MKEVKNMKNGIKIGLVFLVLGILVMSAGLVINGHNANANIVNPNAQQTMPYTVKWAFTAGGSGRPYFLNNLIFVVGSSHTWVYTPQYVQVASLSIGYAPNSEVHLMQLFSLSSSEVMFMYWEQSGMGLPCYYLFNTTTYLLSSEYSVNYNNNYPESGYPYNPQITPMPNGLWVAPYYSLGSQGIIGESFEHYTGKYRNGTYFTEYRTYWLNETSGGITGYEVINPLTNQTSIIPLPCTIHLFNRGYISITRDGNYTPSGFIYPSYMKVNFTPSFVPIFSNVFIINNYTIAIFGQMLSGLTMPSSVPWGDAMYANASYGAYYVIFVNTNTKTSYMEQLPQSTSYIQKAFTSSGNWQNLIYIDNWNGGGDVGIDNILYNEFTNSSAFIYHNYLYILKSSTTIYWVDSINLTTGSITNISFPIEKNIGTSTSSMIINNILYIEGNNNLFAFTIQPNKLVAIFSYPVLAGNVFTIGQNGNNLLLSDSNNNNIYDFAMYATFPVTINVLGVSSNVFWNISINPIASGISGIYINNLNKTIVNSTHFVVNLFPISYDLNISDPTNYVIYSITTYGQGIQMNANPSKYQFKPTVSIPFNITSDPMINVTFVPAENLVTFNSNLNQGSAWLSKYNLQTNVEWQVKVMHGSSPNEYKFYANSLPPSYSNLVNYTLIQNSTTTNMLFYLQNGTYKYSASTISEFIPISTQNFTIAGNTSISVNFEPNYPHAQLASEVSTIPMDSAWIFQSTSYALYNTTITNTIWTIKGPEYYYGTGQEFVAYFNASGTYNLNLTVINNYGLKNWTTYNLTVTAFHKAKMYFEVSKRVGYWTNTSATYIVNVSYSYQLGAMSNLQGIIDGNSYMKIQYVSFSNKSGNFSYEYFATFNPSSYPLENHTVEFMAYTQDGYYNGTAFEAFFGSVNYGKPFNLIDFLGGPANFIMIIIGILGTIIAVAEIKISRTSDVIIESNGRESVLKAKPVKEKLSQRIANRKKAKKSKSQGKSKGGNKK